MSVHDVVIIGSGPAGYTAAIYTARAGLRPLMLTGALTPGGQLMNTTEVENFPGFPEGVLGPDLMDAMRSQAARFGAVFRAEDVVSVAALPEHTDAGDPAPSDAPSDAGHAVKALTLASGEVIHARAVIVTTGSSYRKLGVPGEAAYAGHGVSYCATCDGFFFKDKPIIVVGGGDSAFEEAMYLTRFGSSVTLVHRRDEFRASAIMVDRARATDKLTLLTNTVVDAIHGTADAPASVHADAAAAAITVDAVRPAVVCDASAIGSASSDTGACVAPSDGSVSVASAPTVESPVEPSCAGEDDPAQPSRPSLGAFGLRRSALTMLSRPAASPSVSDGVRDASSDGVTVAPRIGLSAPSTGDAQTATTDADGLNPRRILAPSNEGTPILRSGEGETSPASFPLSSALAAVTSVTLRDTVTGETRTVPAAAVFVAIGHAPATAFLGDAVAKDEDGYVLVDGASTRTSLDGVFAAGDCVDRTYRQAISAAGMGCRAALDAQSYLAG